MWSAVCFSLVVIFIYLYHNLLSQIRRCIQCVWICCCGRGDSIYGSHLLILVGCLNLGVMLFFITLNAILRCLYWLKTWCGWKETFLCPCVFSVFVCSCVTLFDRIDNNHPWKYFLILWSWSACGYACVCVKVAHGCVYTCVWKIEHNLRWPFCFSPGVAAWSSLSRPGRPVSPGLCQAQLSALDCRYVPPHGVWTQLLMCAWRALSCFSCINSHIILLQLLVLLGWLHYTLGWNFKK